VSEAPRSGGCLCGQVRFRTTGEPLNVRVCHCRSCQRAMAGPFFARALFAGGAYSIEGPLGRHATSDHLERVWCTACGVRVMAERRDGSAAGLALTLFDEPGAFRPDCHIFVEDKVPWLVLDDGLPQHAQRPPA
jgi:hypothetical protein